MKIARIPCFAAVLALTVTLPACQQSATPDTQEESAATSAPDAKPGLELSEGKLILPVIPGRPGAVYFRLHNAGDKPVSVASAYVEGAANAEIHETSGGTMKAVDKVDVAPGETIAFTRGGLHIMAFELPAEFQPGDTTELTLTFSDGDKISAPLEIEALNGMGGTDMPEMDHAGPHREAKN